MTGSAEQATRCKIIIIKLLPITSIINFFFQHQIINSLLKD